MRVRGPFTAGSLLRNRLPLALVALCVALAVAIPARPGVAHPGGSPEQLTQSLVALGARYGAASPADQSRLLGTLVAVAAARQQVLAGLMESDPGEVLRVAVPAGLLAALPASVQAYLEEEVEVEGTLPGAAGMIRVRPVRGGTRGGGRDAGKCVCSFLGSRRATASSPVTSKRETRPARAGVAHPRGRRQRVGSRATSGWVPARRPDAAITESCIIR